MALNFISLYKLTSNESDAAKFLQQRGIIHRERFCECGSVMKGIMKTSHGSQIPGWRCTTRACDKYKGVRPNTWLDPSKTPLDTVVHFIYWWAREQTSIIFCERELGMNHNTTVGWSQYMREVCAYHMLQKENDGHQIGGPNLTVEIDESLFSKRSVYSHKLSSISTVSISRKNNVGRVFPPQWVFGGICRQTRETFIVAVPDRTAETLLAVVRAKIAVGSTVMSDCWRSYNMVVVFF